MSIFNKIVNTVTDYAKVVTKAAVAPTEFVTKKSLFTPKYRTELGAGVGGLNKKITDKTIPFMYAQLKKSSPEATAQIAKVEKAGKYIPADTQVPVSSKKKKKLEKDLKQEQHVEHMVQNDNVPVSGLPLAVVEKFSVWNWLKSLFN